jgi:hypothetical protein
MVGGLKLRRLVDGPLNSRQIPCSGKSTKMRTGPRRRPGNRSVNVR